MNTVTLVLVTVVAERVLEDRLLADLRALGCRGWTLTDVRGEGSRGVHASDWQGGNIKVETLVSPETADRILGHLAARFFADYAVIAYTTPAYAVRAGKFT
jgi:nitrogen regulatory protein P-II 2